MDWQPISTAPRDGTLILVYGVPEDHPRLEVRFTEPTQVTAYWDHIDEAFCVNGADWLGPFIEPTFWQPLPDPPTN